MAEQTCKDCAGRGWIAGPLYALEGSYKCPTCDETGSVYRTGPYKLADGTWSDGVDRSERIQAWDWGKSNPSRLSVICAESDTDTYEGFFVYRGNEHLFDEPEELFPTHAEAIAYADRHARTTKNGDNK